jgi:hypothetical protein
MPNPTILPPLQPQQSPPERRHIRRAHAKRSKEGEIKAQEGNKDGNKIIGDIIGDYYNQQIGHYIGFDDEITDILGITNTLNKIYLEGLTHSGEAIENMLLTNINDGADKEYLLSIRLYNDDDKVNTAFTNTLYDFLQSIGVEIYLFDKDFRQFYKVENIRIIMPNQLSLKFILFVDNDINYNIKINKMDWKHETSHDNIKLNSFKYDKIILGCSLPSSFLEDLATKYSTAIAKINAKTILSKSAMFCISLILYITYTAEIFYSDFPEYRLLPQPAGGGNNQALGGNKVVKKKCKNKLPKNK